MEDFKIENFKNDNPSKDFPHFNTLDLEQAKEIYNKLSEKIGGALPPDQLVKKINEKGAFVQDNNAEDDDFLLKTVFERIEIVPQDKVYLNWYRFDNIDIIRFNDLNRYFDDIWYPSSDDIDIFDETFLWIVSISHYGGVSVVEL